jgi:DNA-directed RNA polymerase specialized sigma24 family protein
VQVGEADAEVLADDRNATLTTVMSHQREARHRDGHRVRSTGRRPSSSHRLGLVRHCYNGTQTKGCEGDWLAERFEDNRARLRAVAYRRLGSLSEADDALQESWLRLSVHLPDPIVSGADGVDPEHEALLADSVGLALLVVLDTLTPAERLTFVLHDMCAVPFDEIALIVGRSPAAARQLASRARRRVQGAASQCGEADS